MTRALLSALFVLICGCDGTLHIGSAASGDAGNGFDAPAGHCTTSSDCPAQLHCETTSGECVACIVDDDCPNLLPRCDASLHRCVACGVDGDCDPTRTCELTTRRCTRKCTTTDDCAGTMCDTARGFCIECTKDAECTGKKHCELASGMCVDCVSDAQCTSPKPRCEPVGAFCVECLSNADCPQAKPVCNAAAVCIPR